MRHLSEFEIITVLTHRVGVEEGTANAVAATEGDGDEVEGSTLD